MTPIDELLASTETRARALELMLVAHVALDRTCLERRRPPAVSREARLAIRGIRALPAAVPLDADVVCTAIAVGHSDAELARVDELITDAAALTVAELSFLSREAVLSCLGAAVIPKKTRAARTLEAMEASAA